MVPVAAILSDFPLPTCSRPLVNTRLLVVVASVVRVTVLLPAVLFICIEPVIVAGKPLPVIWLAVPL